MPHRGTADKEAPKLVEQVKAGKLPPLAERLPKKPLVLKPFEQAGFYGGTLRLSSPSKVTAAFHGGPVDWDPLHGGLVDWDPVNVKPGARP